jgi:hypothetical protein
MGEKRKFEVAIRCAARGRVLLFLFPFLPIVYAFALFYLFTNTHLTGFKQKKT